MKNNEVCPKCNSKEIVKVKHSHNSKIYIGFADKARLAKYVCTSCGYIEEWIDNETDLGKINDEYSE